MESRTWQRSKTIQHKIYLLVPQGLSSRKVSYFMQTYLAKDGGDYVLGFSSGPISTSTQYIEDDRLRCNSFKYGDVSILRAYSRESIFFVFHTLVRICFHR